jgi:hypothetical protein
MWVFKIPTKVPTNLQSRLLKAIVRFLCQPYHAKPIRKADLEVPLPNHS